MPLRSISCALFALLSLPADELWGHGSAVSPSSRVYNVFQANPENPNFELAANAVALDSKSAYYTWNQVSRNVPEAVQQGLPPGFDYSPWAPDGQLASGGRVDAAAFGDLTYRGLDQVGADWPAAPATAGRPLAVDFYATAVHEPSVWDVWLTTPDWSPDTALAWSQMEFLGRPSPVLSGNNYAFDVAIPADRSGRHVLWIAWQRDDPVGEVFFSTSDLLISPADNPPGDYNRDGAVDAADYTLWRDAFGQTGPGLPADGDSSGAVDRADYDLWRAAYRAAGPSANSLRVSGAVPEPSGPFAALLFLLGVTPVRLALDRGCSPTASPRSRTRRSPPGRGGSAASCGRCTQAPRG